jgi:hypothetical protein
MSKKTPTKRAFPTCGAESENARKAPSFLVPFLPFLSLLRAVATVAAQQARSTPRKQEQRR